MAPIELDDYGPPPTSSSITPTGHADDPTSSEPLLPSSSNNHPTRHTRFASPQPGDPHYHRDREDEHDQAAFDDDEFHNVPDPSPPGPRNWRPAGRSQRQRSRSSSNPISFFPNTRKFPLLLVGLIGVPVLLLSLIYGIIRGNAPDLLPDLHLPEIIYGGKGDHSKSLAERCVCGGSRSGSGKERTEGERVCEVYGKEGLLWSRLHEGTGNRIKGFVKQAKTGRKLKVGILGGSVSACHGLHIKPGFPGGDPAGPGCYPTVFNDWLHKTFPMPDGEEHEIFNGAIGAMDSSYYAFCGSHHIPRDVDLIILEFDLNDQATPAYRAFFDQLLRVLLELPSQPAVLILGAWSPLIAQNQGYGDPQVAHLPVAHYYDVPYLSVKRVVWNTYLRWPKELRETFYQSDGVHPKARGHRLMADLLMAYLESQICEYGEIGVPEPPSRDTTVGTTLPFSDFITATFPFDNIAAGDEVEGDAWKSTYDHESLSRIAFEPKRFVGLMDPLGIPFTPIEQPLRDVVDDTRPSPENADLLLNLVQPKPFCADANDPENPMKPTKSEGWEKFVWKNEKHFWKSDKPGKRISVDIDVSQGRVAVYYWRSKTLAGGTARCWVDDNESGAEIVKSWWDRPYNMASVSYIDEMVTPGKHYVTCEIMDRSSNPADKDQREFRLIAVMAT